MLKCMMTCVAHVRFDTLGVYQERGTCDIINTASIPPPPRIK
jgi:hypothetical protein